MAVIATAPIVARGVEHLFAKGVDRRAGVVTAMFAAFFLSRVPIASLPAAIQVGNDAFTPAGFFSESAMRYASGHELRGNVYVSNNLGGFVTWWLYPDARVFQDSRLQAYPPDLFRQMLSAWQSQPAWDAIVKDVDWAILSRPRDNELSGTSRFATDDWAIAFQDQAITIVVRKTGAYGPLADAPELR
jgi:hypothetical protein